MIRYYLEFEKTIEELELKIEELKRISDGKDIDISSEINVTTSAMHTILKTPWCCGRMIIEASP